jgi:ligand-binding SRPBCC domain-containing protein
MGVSRGRLLIQAPLSQVWDFLIMPENIHLWGPYTRPVTGFDRPFAPGDRVTLERKDILDFWRHRSQSQVLLVEKVVPYHSLHLRDLSPGSVRLNVTVVVSVEEAGDREATWIEEAISYSLGKSKVMQWLDRLLINPPLQVVVRYASRQAFRRLKAILEQPHTPVSS